jgi:serine/threonine protein kinase
MAFLHSHHVVHGALNTTNILLQSNPRDPYGCTAKVALSALHYLVKPLATLLLLVLPNSPCFFGTDEMSASHTSFFSAMHC